MIRTFLFLTVIGLFLGSHALAVTSASQSTNSDAIVPLVVNRSQVNDAQGGQLLYDITSYGFYGLNPVFKEWVPLVLVSGPPRSYMRLDANPATFASSYANLIFGGYTTRVGDISFHNSNESTEGDYVLIGSDGFYTTTLIYQSGGYLVVSIDNLSPSGSNIGLDCLPPTASYFSCTKTSFYRSGNKLRVAAPGGHTPLSGNTRWEVTKISN